MLNFMRQQDQILEQHDFAGKAEANVVPQIPRNPLEPQHKSRSVTDIPKSTGGTQEFLTVSAKDKDVRRTTFLLVVLFGAGLLCLGFMIKKSVPQTLTAAVITEESQIEAAIAQLTGVKSEMFSRLDEIVGKFYQFSNVNQVGIDELIRNPFEHQISYDVETELDIGTEVNANMELLSIMKSGRDDASRCCMIGDKILYEGESIGGFKVRQIGDNFVMLESKNTELELRLSE